MSRGRPRWEPDINTCINLATAMADQIPVRNLPTHIGISRHLLHSAFSGSLDGYSPLRKTPVKQKRGRKKDTSRDKNMCNMYLSGITLEEIGNKYGVTRERIRQILKSYGITGKDGGMTKKAKDNKRIREQKKKETSDRITRNRYGCDSNEWKYYRSFDKDYHKTPLHKFREQRSNARERGVKWNITINEWWSVWEASGKWDERGKYKDSYVMARFDDYGAYELGNVKIITVSENSKEYYDHHMDEWRQKMIDSHNWNE